MNKEDMLRRIEARIAALSRRETPLQSPGDSRSAAPESPECKAGTTPGAHPSPPEPIAIIGLSGYLPKCRTVRDFWRALETGESLLEEIPKTRFDWRKYYEPGGNDPMKSPARWGGFIPDIRGFDAGFFRMLPRDAKTLDPRQRLLLMSVYHTLEDAGIAPDSLRKSRTGVFVGAEENEYVKSALWDRTRSEGIGNAPSMIANQVSYFFDWRGPSEYLNTMCSGGAVAIHRAVASLRSGESELAVAGVANLLLRPETYLSLSALGQLCHGDRIASFGREAGGYLPAEGVASLLLKPLARAEADGDPIYAVLRHTAVNFNGQGGMSIAAPNIASHTGLILQCYREARLDPRDLGYIEAQGMANPVTDIAEWQAYNRALRILAREQGIPLADGHCRVSTLKPTLGHMQSASAFGALFKILRSLETGIVYGIRGFTDAGPDLETEHQPCRLAAADEPWPVGARPRLAGLHSYGSGGNNAHLLIEEYRPRELPAPAPERPQILVFSATTRVQCRTRIADLLETVRRHPEYPLAAIARTLRAGRDAMQVRAAFVARNRDQWLRQAEAYLGGAALPEGVFEGTAEAGAGSLEIPGAGGNGGPEAAARRWTQGREPAWPEESGPPARLHLPGYSFELKDYWLDEKPAAGEGDSETSSGPKPGAFKPRPETPAAAEITVFNQKALTMSANPEIIRGAGEKAAELFTYCAETSDQDFHEDYLTFCPFPERIPGFSMTRVFLNPKQYRKEMALIQRKQIEMRQVLFFKEEFAEIRYLLDIGCGHGTDVIQIAHHYPHIHTDGFTITRAQADLGNHRIAQKGLSARARIFNHDSSKVKFPRQDYDVAIGLEVSCLVRDKNGLFGNIAASLKNHGRVLLMDFIANLHGAIEDPGIDIYIPTREQWAINLAKHHLVIDELIDVSPQIANFQHDPEHEENIRDCPKVVRDSWRNYANNAVAIERGWLSYMLFRVRKDRYSRISELESRNLARLGSPKSYPDALREMQETGHIPYPILDESLLADAYPDQRRSSPRPARDSAAPQSRSDFHRLKQRLSGLFQTTLSLPENTLEQAETFQELGISSLHSVELLQAINGAFGLKLPTSLIFEHNSLDALTRYLKNHLKEKQPGQLESLRNPPAAAGEESAPAGFDIPGNPLKEKLLALFSETLDLSRDSLSAIGKFNELGLTSIHAVELMEALNSEFGLSLPTSLIFECNSLDALAHSLEMRGVTAAGGAQKKSRKIAVTAR